VHLTLLLLAGQVAFSSSGAATADRLAAHLCAENFELVPAGHLSTRTVLADTSSSTFVLQVEGARSVRYELEATPRAVAELELFHRTVLALREVGLGETRGSTVAYVALEDSLSVEDRGMIIRGALGAGLGVTRTSTRATYRLCAARLRDVVTVGASLIDASCTPKASYTGSYVIRGLIERPPVPPARKLIPPVEVEAETPLWFGVEAALGVMWRTELDPVLSIGARGGRGMFGVRADVLLTVASNDRLQVYETFLVAGPQARFDLGDFEAFVALRIGAHLHQFSIDSDAGVRVNFTADLPAGIAYQLGPVALRLEVAPGIGRAREHVIGQEVLWSRGGGRVSATLGAAVEF
jgi:hypothetical protein